MSHGVQYKSVIWHPIRFLLGIVQLKCDGTTHGRGSEGETGEWSGWPVLFTLPRNVVYPALLPLMRTPQLPAVD
jgi:hypothetical protein